MIRSWFLVSLLLPIFVSASDKPSAKILLAEYPPYFSRYMENGGVLFNVLTKLIEPEDWDASYSYVPTARLVVNIKGNDWLIASFNKALEPHQEVMVFPTEIQSSFFLSN